MGLFSVQQFKSPYLYTVCLIILKRIQNFRSELFQKCTHDKLQTIEMPEGSKLKTSMNRVKMWGFTEELPNSVEEFLAVINKLPILDPLMRAIAELFLRKNYEQKGNNFALQTSLKRLIALLDAYSDDEGVKFFSYQLEKIKRSPVKEFFSTHFSDTSNVLNTSITSYRFFKTESQVDKSRISETSGFQKHLISYFVPEYSM